MKIIAAFLLLASFSVSAQELDATVAALDILPAGAYSGVTPQGDDCKVKVSSDEHGVAVVASSADVSVSRLVLPGTTYRYNPAQRLFLSSHTIETRHGSYENVFRTLAVEAKTQYVVVTRNRNGHEVKVECVVNL